MSNGRSLADKRMRGAIEAAEVEGMPLQEILDLFAEIARDATLEAKDRIGALDRLARWRGHELAPRATNQNVANQLVLGGGAGAKSADDLSDEELLAEAARIAERHGLALPADVIDVEIDS